MIKAKSADRALIGALLARSFEKNKSVNYIIRQDEKWLKRLDALMAYSFEVCSLFGEVWLSDDRKGCALFLYPHLKNTTWASLWLDVQLIFKVIGIKGLRKALQREAAIKKLQPEEKMLYLWFIGVDPAYQHKGTGSVLLQEVLDFAGKKELPVYLETSTLENLPWYQRFDFKIYEQLVLTYTLFFLKWDPNKE